MELEWVTDLLTWKDFVCRCELLLEKEKKKSAFLCQISASEFFFKFKSISRDFFYRKGVTKPCIALYNIYLLFDTEYIGNILIFSPSYYTWIKTLCINDLEVLCAYRESKIKILLFNPGNISECLLYEYILYVRNNLILCNISSTNDSSLWQHLGMEQTFFFPKKWKETLGFFLTLALDLLIWYLSSGCSGSQCSLLVLHVILYSCIHHQRGAHCSTGGGHFSNYVTLVGQVTSLETQWFLWQRDNMYLLGLLG